MIREKDSHRCLFDVGTNFPSNQAVAVIDYFVWDDPSCQVDGPACGSGENREEEKSTYYCTKIAIMLARASWFMKIGA